MIHRFDLLRNIGQFDSVDAGGHLELKRLALIYAENGRGKTTLAAVLRSLCSGEREPIEERRRLGSTDPPHVVIALDPPPTPAVFINDTWSRTIPEVVVYDDVFVDNNVYSGLSVDAAHRQNLNEVILGAQGVTLNRTLRELVQDIETHNRALRTKADAISPGIRGDFSVDDFCALAPRPDIDDALDEARRALAAVSEAAAIQRATPLNRVSIPTIDMTSVNSLSHRDLPALDGAAVAQVEMQVEQLGRGARAWIAEGVTRLSATPEAARPCPFCTQDTNGVDLVDWYRAYFSAEYTALKADLSAELATMESLHGTMARSQSAAVAEKNEQQWHYWSRFADMPLMNGSITELLSAWARAYEYMRRYLEAKNSAPLEQLELSKELLQSVATFERLRVESETLNDAIDEANRAIALVKERAASGSLTAIEADVRRLTTLKLRHSADVSAACTEYLAEKSAKAVTEAARDQARQSLDAYRAATFPAYETAINVYLQRLNAGFRVASIVSTTTRGGASCTYNVVVNNEPVAVGTTTGTGSPSFRNVLSAGDRNTLALAFFFTSLDRDPLLASKIVVVDDPMTSLDEHRLLATAQELRRLSQRAEQVLVLSHDKPFLFRVWDGADRGARSAMAVVRVAQGSTLRNWDVTADMVTEHDRRHAALREYLATSNGNARDVAESLRLILEAYLRASYPEGFGPGDLIGPFIDRCRAVIGGPAQMLKAADVAELQDLKEYVNRFHHDSNPTAQGTMINEAELAAFARRVLDFTRRP